MTKLDSDESDDGIVSVISARMPLLPWELRQLLDGLIDMFRKMTTENHPAAVIDVVAQGVNDYVDLADSLQSGRGRAAARTARALIEEAATLKYLSGNTDACQRYLDHRAVGRYRLSRLPGSDQSADAKGLPQRQRQYSKVIEKYGENFRRSWSGIQISHLVRELTPELMDYYEVSSMVVHSAGLGVHGALESIDGQPVYRIGPAWQLCPDAFKWGLLALREIAENLTHPVVRSASQRVIGMIDDLAAIQATYRDAVREQDDALWPREPPMHLVPVMALARSGTERWYLMDREQEHVWQATTPQSISGINQETREAARAALDASPPSVRWIGLVALGTEVLRSPGTAPIPLASLFHYVMSGEATSAEVGEMTHQGWLPTDGFSLSAHEPASSNPKDWSSGVRDATDGIS